ncbi:MAG: hypothetical protein H6732_13800 [Alphaproteobacteria bacterium]|nr:hypothetical protein [Alphaproteobacteria bacterium]
MRTTSSLTTFRDVGRGLVHAPAELAAAAGLTAVVMGGPLALALAGFVQLRHLDAGPSQTVALLAAAATCLGPWALYGGAWARGQAAFARSVVRRRPELGALGAGLSPQHLRLDGWVVLAHGALLGAVAALTVLPATLTMSWLVWNQLIDVPSNRWIYGTWLAWGGVLWGALAVLCFPMPFLRVHDGRTPWAALRRGVRLAWEGLPSVVAVGLVALVLLAGSEVLLELMFAAWSSPMLDGQDPVAATAVVSTLGAGAVVLLGGVHAVLWTAMGSLVDRLEEDEAVQIGLTEPTPEVDAQRARALTLVRLVGLSPTEVRRALGVRAPVLAAWLEREPPLATRPLLALPRPPSLAALATEAGRVLVGGRAWWLAAALLTLTVVVVTAIPVWLATALEGALGDVLPGAELREARAMFGVPALPGPLVPVGMLTSLGLQALILPWLLRSLAGFTLAAAAGRPSASAFAVKVERPVAEALEAALLGVGHLAVAGAAWFVVRYLLQSAGLLVLGISGMSTAWPHVVIERISTLVAMWAWIVLLAPLLAAPLWRVAWGLGSFDALRRAWALRLAGGWWRIGLLHLVALGAPALLSVLLGLAWDGLMVQVGTVPPALRLLLELGWWAVLLLPLWMASQAVAHATTAGWGLHLDRWQRARARRIHEEGVLTREELARLHGLPEDAVDAWLAHEA